MTPDDLKAAIFPRVEESERVWVTEARRDVAIHPDRVGGWFADVTRTVGDHPLDPAHDPASPATWTVDDAVRVLLVASLQPEARNHHVAALFANGSTQERRGLLRALGVVELDADVARDLLHAAVDSGDPEMLMAALGPATLPLLDDEALAGALAILVADGVDVTAVEGLRARLTARLIDRLRDVARARQDQGAAVPAPVRELLALG